MPLRRGRVGREQAERPEAAASDADEVGSLPILIPEPVEGVGVVGLAVEDIGSLPVPVPEPVEGAVGEPPVLLAREPDTAVSALNIGTLPVPIPEPAGGVGYAGGGNPAILAGSVFEPVADTPGSLSEPLQVEGITGLGDEEGPVPASEPTELLVDEEEGPVQP